MVIYTWFKDKAGNKVGQKLQTFGETTYLAVFFALFLI